MRLHEARRILTPYLPAGAVTSESVRAAFREAVKANHPDSWDEAIEVRNPIRMDKLKEARDVMLASLGNAQEQPAGACPVCRGSGYQAIGMRKVPCVRGCDPA